MQHARVAIALSVGLTLTAFGASAQTSRPSPDFAGAARSAAQQQQLIEQQRQAQERAQTVNAPAVRSGTPNATGWPDLPAETPCFRIRSFFWMYRRHCPMSFLCKAPRRFRRTASHLAASGSSTTADNVSANKG